MTPGTMILPGVCRLGRFLVVSAFGSLLRILRVSRTCCAEIRAILLECTELPPYADALRFETALPVYDAITCADMFVDGYVSLSTVHICATVAGYAQQGSFAMYTCFFP